MSADEDPARKKQFEVKFYPEGKGSFFPRDMPLRDAAAALGIVLESTCGGVGTCGKCRVIIDADGVTPPTELEQQKLSADRIEEGYRLACQALIQGDVQVRLPLDQHYAQQQILADGTRGEVAPEPAVRKLNAQVPEPEMDVKGRHMDLEALTGTLELNGVHADTAVVRSLPGVLRGAKWNVTAVLHGDALIAVEPGDTTEANMAVAFDVGTSTLVGKLLDLNTGQTLATAARANSQRVFGGDIMTRLTYLLQNESGRRDLHEKVMDDLNKMMRELVARAKVSAEHVYEVSVVGNPLMNHLVLDVDPTNLGSTPFSPAFQGPLHVASRDVGFEINPGGRAFFLPNLAGFVGSDTCAALATLDLETADEPQILVDIGTNCEIVLGMGGRVMCCSSPAGPAFEGGQIAWGMRATRGAIESVRINGDAVEIKTIGNKPPLGLCGSGLIDAVAEILRAGIMNQSGRISPQKDLEGKLSPALTGRINQGECGHEFVLAEDPSGKPITITQADVRQVQLAKGALGAGIQVLLECMGIETADLARFYVAGTFGNYVELEHARRIGLFPNIPLDRVRYIGNAACAGAEIALISRKVADRIRRLSHDVEHVETAKWPDFHMYLAEAMAFPGV